MLCVRERERGRAGGREGILKVAEKFKNSYRKCMNLVPQ